MNNYFHDIDDCIHLDGAIHGNESSPHFRPLHFAWNSLNYKLFGIEPFGYHALSLLVHFLSSLLIWHLIWQLTQKPLAAVVGGVAFGAFYAPNEVVMWMAAACSLLVVLFILLACNFYLHYLSKRKWSFFLATIVCMIGAMGCKEDCVVLGPILIALEIHARGWRSLMSKEALTRYGVLLALGLAYLSVAYRPELWADRPDVGHYDVGFGIVPKSLRSVGVLFWPRRIVESEFSSWSFWAGLLLTTGVIILGWCDRQRRGTYFVALSICFVGMLAVLPGPDPIVAKRYVYVSVIGAAMLLGLGFDAIHEWATKRNLIRLQWITISGFVLWIVVQVMAIRSLDQYHFGPAGERTRALVDGTRNQILPLLQKSNFSEGKVVFISPMIWNELDYLPMVSVLLDFPKKRMAYTVEPFDETFIKRLKNGGDLALATHAVFFQVKGGPIRRLENLADAPIDAWRERSKVRAGEGKAETLAVIRFIP
ncbi:MAG: hypothetical protein ACI97A_001605 [Planctomycetota bacterium]